MKAIKYYILIEFVRKIQNQNRINILMSFSHKNRLDTLPMSFDRDKETEMLQRPISAGRSSVNRSPTQKSTKTSPYQQVQEPKTGSALILKRTLTSVPAHMEDGQKSAQYRNNRVYEIHMSEAKEKLNQLHQTQNLSKKLPGVDLFTYTSMFTLGAGFLLMVLSGLAMCVGAVTPYIVSFYRQHLKYDVNYDTFQPMLTLTEITAAFFFPIANYLIDHVFDRQSRPAALIGAVIGLLLLYECVNLRVNPYVFIIMYTSGNGIIKGFYK